MITSAGAPALPPAGGSFMKRNRLWFALAIVVLIATVGGWYVASPAYAMSQLKSAAETGDADQLEERIDFPKVRESLKSQLRAVMAREIAKPELQDNPFGKLGAMVAMGMVDGMVEGFVTPESISEMIKEGKMKRPGQVQVPVKAVNARPVDWTIKRDGLDKFSASPTAPDGKPAPRLLFERDGLGWKLAGLKLPPEGMPTK